METGYTYALIRVSFSKVESSIVFHGSANTLNPDAIRNPASVRSTSAITRRLLPGTGVVFGHVLDILAARSSRPAFHTPSQSHALHVPIRLVFNVINKPTSGASTDSAGGDEEYCAILVAVNSILQMVLYAPLAILFIEIISQGAGRTAVSYATAAKSVAAFLGISLGAAILTRPTLRNLEGPEWYEKVLFKWPAPWSLVGLLFSILVTFVSQGRQVIHQIVSVVRVAAPLFMCFMIIFFFTLFVCNELGYVYKLDATQSFTAASNNFELTIAVAVATCRPESDQALAATVGPLIEVPVLVELVYLVSWMGGRWSWKGTQ